MMTKRFIRSVFFVLVWLGIIGGTSHALAQENLAPFRVALTGKYPPFSYYDNMGQLTGFDVDVSHDGTRLLFAWKTSDREDDYHLYELDRDSGHE